MGLDYVYVGNGNDIGALIDAFRSVKDAGKPVVVHIVTLKGKGYKPAEEDKETWHWHMPFDIKTGEPLMDSDGEDYSSVTAGYLLDKMKKIKVLSQSRPQHLRLWDLRLIKDMKPEAGL